MGNNAHSPSDSILRKEVLLPDKPVGTVEGVWTLGADGKWRSKGGSIRCEHGREHYYCKDCGGAGICEHGRLRHRCKDCGGASICEHGRERYYCKDCGGAGICEHGRERRKCKDCGSAGALNTYKHSAKDRNYSWQLTDDRAWWLMRQACIYCGSTDEVNGIDRVKNEYGYTVMNSVPCCGVCNKMKLTHSAPEFLAKVNEIVSHTATYEAFKTKWIATREDGPDCHFLNSVVEPVAPLLSADSTTQMSMNNSAKPITAEINSTSSFQGQRRSQSVSMAREEDRNDRS